MTLDAQFLTSILQIIWIDILLSGDNAVVIALACRSLPERQRRLGVVLGAGTAVLLRIIFAFIISQLLALPLLKLVGGLLLLWIAVKLVTEEEEDGHDIKESGHLWGAVRTIAIADAVMSLDNVVAIAAAAKGHAELFIFGLILSIPLVVFGSTMIMALIARFPVFVWAGAALLGWIAGEMIISDPWIIGHIGEVSKTMHYVAAAAGAALVIVIGWAFLRLAGRREVSA
ncbi:TerC family protein [Chelatococcus sp. SYSU_G07232]|uniref:TerC family protein n=1 Tax=Chelatococcus albus TaxID=3047466 RepID=A0ABT7AF10_9HYPH|nr:TerC family protein [Chelatococcus sp. SYSU_G07232]MDJ1157955.1 TerC family protein [Chelatococcus sp. SYSU_G07232]